MAHMRRQGKGSIGRTVMGLFFIMIGVVVCSVGAFGAMDVYCRSDIDTWAPIYPGAELIDETRSGFIRPRASGLTEQVYYTPDAERDVEEWFRDYRAELVEGRYNVADPNAALGPQVATIQRTVVEAEDGEGALIIYNLECAYN
ncbi:MAG: hypothetical protein AAFN11_08195 [Chloroflexota bacterium]